MPESPQNEPPPLPLTDDCVPLPPVGLALVLLQRNEGQEHSHASPLVMSASWTKEDLLPIEDEEGPTAAPAASAEEAPEAAPAARKRLRYLEAAGRLLFMSWNAGGGARNLPAILIEKGYHFFAIQEAHEDQMAQLHDTPQFCLGAGPLHCNPQAGRDSNHRPYQRQDHPLARRGGLL